MFTKEDKNHYLRLLSYLRPYKLAIVVVFLSTIFYGLTEPIMPWVLKGLIDEGFSQTGTTHNYKAIYFFVTIMIIGFLIRGAANFISTYSTVWLGQRIIYDLRSELFAKMQTLPMRYFSQHAQGQIVSKFSYDVNQLLSAVTDTLIRVIRDVITVIALLITLFILDWKMTLILLCSSPIIVGVIAYISRHLRDIASNLQKNMGSINHIIDENVRARAIVRVYNAQDYEKKRFNKEALEIQKNILAFTKVSEISSPIIEMIVIFSLAAIVLLMASNVGGDVSNGQFVAFLGAMALLFPPIKRLSKANEAIQRALAAMQSIFSFLDETPEFECQTKGNPIQKGAIEFKDVSFNYDGKNVLENFNLSIKSGENIALVGQSGAGKSTIAALLTGFYMPNAGALYIDGQDCTKIDLKTRRQSIAYVSQETIIFNSTIKENIAYADENPDEKRIKEAAIAANAHEFIMELEEGYESKVGENGCLLSGGQRQRITIARALYKNAPILILDEATSALDNRSEQKIKEAIENLSKNRTSIIIAHRLSTIKNADRIVVLDQGKIIEMGKHEELLAKEGLYAALVNTLSQEEYENENDH